MFAADAVLEEDNGPRILSFNDKKARLMTYPEMRDYDWLQDDSHLVNVWKIGGRYFVLEFIQGYEGFGVELMELTPDGKLVSTGLGFGAGG